MVAMAATAPAYAASCQSTAPSAMNLTSKIGADGATVLVSNAFAGVTAGANNLGTAAAEGLPAGWLRISNQPRGDGGASDPSVYQDVTFTFSRPVTDLRFTITDIDTSGGWFLGNYRDFYDAVAVQSVAGTATFTSTLGADLQGSGTTTNPWRQDGFTNAAAGSTDAAHRVVVSFAGALTSLTLRYWSIDGRSTYTGAQAVWVGDMTYKSNCV